MCGASLSFFALQIVYNSHKNIKNILMKKEHSLMSNVHLNFKNL